MSKDFSISDLLKITEYNKYEAAVAGMEVINHLEQMSYPKKHINRKPAVKAMMALSEGMIKYDYIDDEARIQLEEELKDRARIQAQSALDGIFSTPGSSAPAVDESNEDLEEIGETIPPEKFSEESIAMGPDNSEISDSDSVISDDVESDETESDETESDETESDETESDDNESDDNESESNNDDGIS